MAGRRETVSDEEILRFFVESPDPVLGTAEIADLLDFSNPGAQKRLDQLEEDDLLKSKRIGNSLAWWITDRGREYLSGDQDADELDE